MAKDKKKSDSGAYHAPNHFLEVMCSDRTRVIVGLVLLLFGVFYLMSYISFFSTGKYDQALIEFQEADKHYTPDNGYYNWGGYWGALLAEYTVNRWIGVSAVMVFGLLLLLGFFMVYGKPVKQLLARSITVLLWALWISLTLGLFSDFYGDTDILWGGLHGYQASVLMRASVGLVGSILVVVGTGLGLSAFTFATTIDKIRWFISAGVSGANMVGEKTGSTFSSMLHRGDEVVEEGDEEEGSEEEEESVGDPQPVQNTDLEPETVYEPEPQPVYEPEPESVYVPEPQSVYEPEPDPVYMPEPQPVYESATASQPVAVPQPQPVVSDPAFTVQQGTTETLDKPVDMPLEDYDPTADLSQYQFPSWEILKAYDHSGPVDMDEQNENMEKIRQTLSDYGIEIQDIKATVGPTITLYEIVLVNGIRINKVRNLSDEIAMSIAAKAGVRIIAPIPGKCAIGIEVPNNHPEIVSMRECIQSRAFQESKFELPVALGKTITNEVFTFDLAKTPHLLVAGATGQGKSVGLNAIITSLLYKKHPSQLKIVLVDPKMVEFGIYKRIEKHFLAKLEDQENPIITDVSRVVDTLKSLCAEMEDRYALVEDAGVRNIKEYNEKFIHRQLNPTKHIEAPIGSKDGTHHRYLPYIVVVIDEYGDLIMTAGKEIEIPIARIAQKARAVGIHMIIATQRPSAKIVTGMIKANFPARIAFRVSQGIDSNIIIDQPGAQNLIGKGDLLYSTGNMPQRVQCAFVDTPEVDGVNRFIADQVSFPTALILPRPKPAPGEGGDDDEGNAGSVDLRNLDAMFDDAAELVVATGQGSTSMIQRKFQIGYNRAGRIMDQLEAAGIVGPYTGSKARAVLVDSDSELQNILEGLKSR